MECTKCPRRKTCTEICEAVENVLPGMGSGTNNDIDLRQVVSERIAVRRILDWEHSSDVSQGQREIINLYYRQSLPVDKITKRLGITKSAVYDRLKKLHVRLTTLSMQEF